MTGTSPSMPATAKPVRSTIAATVAPGSSCVRRKVRPGPSKSNTPSGVTTATGGPSRQPELLARAAVTEMADPGAVVELLDEDPRRVLGDVQANPADGQHRIRDGDAVEPPRRR
jgi:hypothetical protein